MILSRYLLFEYLKVLLLCVASFIAILMTTRLEDIARFAAYGASPLAILRFVTYQVPYVLPMATGVAALISSITLVSRLSSSQELTALRASGLSLKEIFTPILAAAGVIACINFIIVSEVATTSQLKSRQLKQQISLINPLTLIQSKQLVQNKDLYLSTESQSFAQGALNNVTLAIWNDSAGKLGLVKADKITYIEPDLKVEGLFTLASKDASLYTENVDSSQLNIQSFSSYLKQQTAKIKNDYLRLEYLLVRLQNLFGKSDKASLDLYYSGYSEIFRRVSVALAVFTFTLLGIAFGLQAGRRKSLTGVALVALLTSFQLIAFFSAKALETKPYITFALYFAPIFAVALLSLRQIRRFSKGVE